MDYIGTIIKEKYEVTADNYMRGKLAVAEAYIKAHGLGDIKKTNIIGLVSLRQKKQENQGIIIMDVVAKQVLPKSILEKVSPTNEDHQIVPGVKKWPMEKGRPPVSIE